MGLKFNLFIVQCIIICTQYNFIHGDDSRNARLGEFPFVVSIKGRNNHAVEPEMDHICAGVLVSNKDVLTLDRCFQEFQLSGVEIVVGSINIRTGNRHYPVWWLSFEQWATIRNFPIVHAKNDLSIVRLSQLVSPAIDPVRLSTSQNNEIYSSNAVTAGWGELTVGVIPRILRTAILFPITNAECQEKSNRIYGQISYQVRENVICTNGDHHGPWHLMDFGGPLLFNGELIAINQEIHPFPTNPPHPEKINVHIRIDFYTEYINDVRRNF